MSSWSPPAEISNGANEAFKANFGWEIFSSNSAKATYNLGSITDALVIEAKDNGINVSYASEINSNMIYTSPPPLKTKPYKVEIIDGSSMSIVLAAVPEAF